jgi:hypothetical protein
MKKSDINESMILKLRNGKNCVLLQNLEGGGFYSINTTHNNFEYVVRFSSYNDNLEKQSCLRKESKGEYDIIAIKKFNLQLYALSNLIKQVDIKDWDWIRNDGKETELENLINKLSQQIKEAESELEKIKTR